MYNKMITVLHGLLKKKLFDFRFGRKILLIISCILMAITLAILGGYFLAETTGYSSMGALPLISLIAYAVANRIGLGLVPIVMAGKYFIVFNTITY